MKTIKFLITSVFVFALAFNAAAQTHDHRKMNTSQVVIKTETFKVWGQCDMCKGRIEKTVKAEGVSTASWDEKTQMLTVSIDPAKTSKEVLSKKLAAVGHDTEKFKAPEDVYNKLPGCCHYDRAK
jgi:hypothetical protein